MSRLIAIALLGLYAAGTLYTGVHHEPWRDEADSWLVVRDLPLAGIFQWTRNAGTPALWYVLLKPLVWLGLPFQSQMLLHLAIAWTSMGILFFRAPFSWPVKILSAASYYFSYEYAVIARSYSLTVLLSFLLAAWYRERYRHPLRYAIAVALLFNANVHGGLIAAIFLALFVVRRAGSRLSVPAVAIMLLGAFAAWLQLRPAPDAAFPNVIRAVHPEYVRDALASAFFPGVTGSLAFAGAPVLLLLIGVSLRKHPDAIAAGAVSLTGLLVLFVFVWYGAYRHAGLVLLVTLLAIWIAGAVPRDLASMAAASLLLVSLLISARLAVRMARADIEMAFSGGQEMGEFIRANGVDRYEIAAHNFQQAEAVLPWVPGKRLWYPALGRYGTYMLWNRDDEAGLHVSNRAAVENAIAKFAPREQPWLMLLNEPMPAELASSFRLVYATERPVFRVPDERYWLYLWPGTVPAGGTR